MAWVHQILAAGGVSGSNTLVMLFVMLFALFVRFLTRDSSDVLVVRYKVSHPGLHHTTINSAWAEDNEAQLGSTRRTTQQPITDSTPAPNTIQSGNEHCPHLDQ